MLTIKYLPEIAAFLIFIMISTQVPAIGPLLILAQFGLIGVLILRYPQTFLEIIVHWWPLLLLPLLATLSALWSHLPAVSLRYGLQFLFTAIMGVALARLLSPRQFIIALVLSMFVFLVLCILDGSEGSSIQGPVLIGLTGSKNQIAYIGYLLLLSALTLVMLRGLSPLLRWIAILCLPLALFILAQSNAATAVVLGAVGAALLIALAVLERLPRSGRLATLVGAVVIVSPLLFVIPELLAGMNYFLVETLDKDPTLTGRTLLWDRADDLIAQRPLLGHGYKVIWMGDSTETIALQRLTGIMDGRTFNFHQAFRDVAVDTGFVGLTVFALTMAAGGVKYLMRIVLSPSLPIAFFAVVFLTMIARAFTENIIGPFSLHTILFFAAATYAFAAEQTAPAQPRLQRFAPPRFGYSGAQQRPDFRN